MESLSSKQTPNAVRKALQALPTGVFETYDEVLRRIEDQNEDDRRLARKVLMWLSLSLRPLTVRELQHAVAIDEGLDEFGEDDIASEDIIISVCAGLVSVATKEGVAQLVHYTAHEYFSQAKVRDALFSGGHRELFSSCLMYLFLDDFRDGLPETDGDELDRFIEQHRLFYYAAHNWGHHARIANLEESDQRMISRLFQRDHPLVDLINALHVPPGGKSRRRHPDILVEVDKQGIWLASYYGLLDVVKQLICNGANIDACVIVRGSLKGSWRYSKPHNFNSVRTALTVAAWNNHESVVQLLLEQGAQIQKLDLNGAACNQCDEIVRLLLQHGAHSNDVDGHERRYYGSASEHMSSFTPLSSGYTPLHWSAQSGNESMTKLLLENGAHIDGETAHGNSPLILAAESGHTEVVHLLLQRHANFEHQNALKETAMHRACKMAFTGIVSLLLERKARFTIVDANERERWDYQIEHDQLLYVVSSGRAMLRPRPLYDNRSVREYEGSNKTAFEYALAGDHSDIVQLLLEADSSSVLKKVSPIPLLLAANNNSPRAVELLLKHGANVDSQDEDGRTALFWAAVNDSEEITGMLLSKAAKVNLSTLNEATPLHLAAANDAQRVLKQLVGHGASLSAKTKKSSTDRDKDRRGWYNGTKKWKYPAINGDTPLHVAINAASLPSVKILVDAGADVQAKDDLGRTPIFVAWEMVNRFQSENGMNKEASLITKLLLSRGVSLNTSNQNGVTPLMKAAQNGTIELMQWLLDKSAVVGIQASRGEARKIFPQTHGYDKEIDEHAAQRALEILHSYGANFNTRDNNGYTPLFFAVQRDFVNLLEALCQLGADVTTQNDGTTLLHHLMKGNGKAELICNATSWLLDAGIPIASRNLCGETALLIAASGNCPDVVKLLVERGADLTDRDHRGETALFKCMSAYERTPGENLEMTTVLLELGAVVNDPLGHGGDLASSALAWPKAVFDLLVAEGLDMNTTNKYGSFILIENMYQNDPKLTKRLLNAGAHVGAADSDGSTALHEAARYKCIRNARLLVSGGAKVAQMDWSGRTALHIAFSKRNADLTDYLVEEWISQGSFENGKELVYISLESGHFGHAKRITDALKPDWSKYNVDCLVELYQSAIRGFSQPFLALLEQRLGDTDQTWLIGLFRVAIKLQHHDILYALLDSGLDIDSHDFLGDAPIHVATQSGDEDTIIALLDAQANIEKRDRWQGNTPLLLAAKSKDVWTLELLLERGADVSQANRYGDTALHQAGNFEIIQTLVTAHADTNALNKEKRTPLHCHVANETGGAAIRYLLDAGANVNAKDSYGNSPLHMASAQAFAYGETTLYLLLKYGPDMSLPDGKHRTPLQIATSSGNKKSLRMINAYLDSHSIST
jgi:ankyrin repeat protein